MSRSVNAERNDFDDSKTANGARRIARKTILCTCTCTPRVRCAAVPPTANVYRRRVKASLPIRDFECMPLCLSPLTMDLNTFIALRGPIPIPFQPLRCHSRPRRSSGSIIADSIPYFRLF